MTYAIEACTKYILTYFIQRNMAQLGQCLSYSTMWDIKSMISEFHMYIVGKSIRCRMKHIYPVPHKITYPVCYITSRLSWNDTLLVWYLMSILSKPYFVYYSGSLLCTLIFFKVQHKALSLCILQWQFSVDCGYLQSTTQMCHEAVYLVV